MCRIWDHVLGRKMYKRKEGPFPALGSRAPTHRLWTDTPILGVFNQMQERRTESQKTSPDLRWYCSGED